VNKYERTASEIINFIYEQLKIEIPFDKVSYWKDDVSGCVGV
jgi:hypothetical protein